jgi:hypothetical protein
MKLDTELVREILIKIEELPFDGGFHDIAVDGRTGGEITYHVMILDEAGLIEAMDLSTMDGICWKPKRLTYAGHQFLDAARSDTVWKKATALAMKSTGTLTLEGLKVAIPMVVKALIASPS